MTLWLKQSTTVNAKLGPFVDFVDGVTAKTALTPTVKLSKNGGTLAARNSATAIAHDADGYYTVELDATDTGTLGRMRVTVTNAAAHVPVWQDYMVAPANVWDSMFGSANLQVDPVKWNGTAVATPDTAGYPKVTHKAGTGTGEISLSSGAVTAGTVSDKTGYGLSSAAVQAVWDALTSALTTSGSIGKRIVDFLTGDAFARIGAAGAGLTALGDTRIANLDATVSSRSSHTAADIWSVTTRAITDKAGFALSSAGVQAIWDALTSALTTVGSVGKRIADNLDAAITSRLATAGYTAPPTAVQNRQEMDSNSTKLANLDATVSSRSTLSAAQANAEADTALADVGLTGTVTGRIDAAVSTRSSHSAADVWAAVTRSLTDKAGFSLSSAGVQAIWDALTSALTSVGSIGKLLVDNINATISSRLASAGYTAPDNASAVAAAADASTLVSRLTSQRATNLDNLDAAVSSRLPTSSYSAPTTPPTAIQNADAYLDRADAIETGVTPRKALRLLSAILGGKLSGAGTTTETFRNASADSKDRIVATVDASGNRTAIALDLT